MDEQNNNGIVPPVGGEIASPASAANPVDSQQPVLETPAAPAPAEAAPAEPAAPAVNPTASFAQSTVGNSNPEVPAQNPAPIPAVPTATNTTAAVPAGKSGSAGKIIAIIVILLVLIGGGVGGFLFYRAHESNERVLSDALKNFIEREVVAAKTKATIEAEEMKLTLSLDSVANAESESSMVLDASFEGNGVYPDMNAKLEAVSGKDALYVKVADYGNLATAIGEIAEKDEVEYALAAVFNKIGSDWYEIPYSELGTEYSKSVDCMRDVMKDLKSGNYTEELMKSYKQYPFIVVDGKPEKADGYKLYTVKIDEDLAEKFGDDFENLGFYKDVEKCVESASRGYSSLGSKSGENLFGNLLGNGSNSADRTITALEDDDDYDYDWDDGVDYIVDERSSNKVEPVVKLGIKPWSHKLVFVSVTAESDDVSIKVESNLSEEGTVTIPSDTKSIDELKSQLEEMLNTANSSRNSKYYDLYCTKENNYSGYDNETDCKEAVDELFGGAGGTSIESLIDGFSI
jgi:hypothetical protein